MTILKATKLFYSFVCDNPKLNVENDDCSALFNNYLKSKGYKDKKIKDVLFCIDLAFANKFILADDNFDILEDKFNLSESLSCHKLKAEARLTKFLFGLVGTGIGAVVAIIGFLIERFI